MTATYELKYLVAATFTDHSVFQQPLDDSSKLDPAKTSKHDFLEHSKGRELRKVFLVDGKGRSVLLADAGRFIIGGRSYRIGEKLPPNYEWVEGDPEQGAYFRRIVRSFDPETLAETSVSVQYCIGTNPQRGLKNFVGVR